MAKLYNLARVSTATTGTGTITLGAAVSGFLTFANAGVSDGDVVSYGISDGANSEVGTGTYTAAGTTLTRSVTKSTNSNLAISLSGTAQVYITARAEDIPPMTVVTNSLAADVTLSNVANYFDGPSCAQGTSGTWLAFGTVTVSNPTGSASFFAKLWDGTTLMATGSAATSGASFRTDISLSGYITSPAGNIRISVRDPSNTNSVIEFNRTGNSKDSTLTVVRIG